MVTSGAGNLVDLINHDNHTTLGHEEVRFEKPVPQENGKDRVAVVAVPGNRYKLHAVVEYQRLGLTTIFKCFKPKAQLTPFIDDVYAELLASILSTYGVKLDLAEVEITTREDADGFNFTVTTNDASLQYSEAVEVQGVWNQVDITSVLTQEGSQYQYPTERYTTPFARVYSGGWSVPEVGPDLALYLTGMAGDDNLAWLAQTLSGDTWYYDGLTQRAYNMYSSYVLYNGSIKDWADFHPATGRSLLVPPEGTSNVLVLNLNSYLCSGLNGSVTFYY